MAPPNSSSFSVSVVLPASGWEMMAKVRLFLVSPRLVSSAIDVFLRNSSRAARPGARIIRGGGKTSRSLSMNELEAEFEVPVQRAVAADADTRAHVGADAADHDAAILDFELAEFGVCLPVAHHLGVDDEPGQLRGLPHVVEIDQRLVDVVAAGIAG